MLCCTAVLALLCSCGNKNKFTVEGSGLDGIDGETIYLVNQSDRSQAPDSTVVVDGRFRFSGEVREGWVALVSGSGFGTQFIVEPGDIHLTADSLWGTPLNDSLFSFSIRTMSQVADIQQEMQPWMALYNTPDEAQRDEAEKNIDSLSSIATGRMEAMLRELYNNNRDNILGAMALENLVQITMSFRELDSILSVASPVVANHEPLKAMHEYLRQAEATSVGHRYTDISGQWRAADGTLSDGKLSDLAEGHVTLVDFFASWCGPCRQEIKNNLVGIWKKYKGNGLVVVGLNVWERGDAAKRAEALKGTIDDLGIEYPVLVDSTRNATDAYGVSGIPQIMLIGKDGTILGRDLRDKDIEEAIKKAL